MTDSAPWLKRMENGTLGEARARAFLMERFWVLERSVDIEGADYLIQQRLTANNFLDRDPPRLGVVQVKFIQDGNTYITVPKHYVVDRNGLCYGEFFLVVFTGYEDNQRSFLMSARDMLGEFSETKYEEATMLRLRGAKLVGGSNYEITQRTLALDRIEHALKNADFLANRRFIGQTRYVKLSADQIDHDLTIPLDNEWGNIQREFFNGKKKLQSTLFELEHVSESIHRIISASDPIEALSIYDSEVSDHIGRGAFGRELAFSLEFFDEDFFDVVRKHRARLAKLKELRLEGNYFRLLETYNRTVVKELIELSRDPELRSVEICINYDIGSLTDVVIRVRPASVETKEPQVVSSQQGEQP